MEENKLSEEEIVDGAPFAALSYVFFLWIFVYIFKKENEFARFHARQGIVIFIGEIIFAVLSLLPWIGKVFYVIGLLLFLVVSIYGINCALSGRMIRIPGVSKMADNFIV